MPYLFLTLGLGAFVLAFQYLRILPKVKLSLVRARQALALMSAPEVSEDEKELALQRAALRMCGAFCEILLCSAAALLAAVACAFAGVAVGLYGTGDVLAAGQSPLFLLFLTLLAVAAMKLAK